MKKRYIILLFLLVSLLIGYQWIMKDYAKQQSTIYHNGIILTIEEDQPTAQAILIEKGMIKSIGGNEEILALKSKKTEIIDLEGKILMPGFIDPHSHIALSTFLHSMVDLSGFKHSTEEGVWNHLRKAVADSEPGEWIVCKGFDPMLIEGLKTPHIDFLDEIAPQNPVIILAQSLHSFWGNSKAFEAVGVDKNTPDPTVSSYYERDSAGALTGFIAEQEAFKAFQDELLATVTPKQTVQATIEVLKGYAKKGNTTVVGMGLTIKDDKALLLYDHLSSNQPKFLNQLFVKLGYLPKRSPNPRQFVYIRHDTHQLLPKSPNNGNDFYKVLGIKHWYDGSPYTGSMYLAEPYDTSELTTESFHLEHGHTGEALVSEKDLYEFVKKYQSEGWQIAFHVQGDLAVKEVLSAYQKLNQEMPTQDFRHRLEHNLLMPTNAIEQLKELNITPSFHINHIYYYGKALKNDIIGEERANKVLPAASAHKMNVPFSLHADQPMFESDPFHLMQTAILRKTAQGDVLGKQEAITPIEALKSLTIYAAWQLKMEDKIGSLKVGKYGDLVILDKNPLETAVEDWRKIKILETIVAGNRVN